MDAIRYLVDNGCKWRALPADFPPFQTVFGFFARRARAGVLARIRDQLRARSRTGRGYCRNPVAIIIDSQTVRAAETVGTALAAGTPPRRSTGGSVTWPVTWAACPWR